MFEELLRDGGQYGGQVALAYRLGELANFRQGGRWDAQRIGGKYHKEYQDYSSIAIGLYAAAAGISESEILRLQDTYAWMHSHFAPHTEFDETYRHLPKRNVKNTQTGYLLYQSDGARAGGE